MNRGVVLVIALFCLCGAVRAAPESEHFLAGVDAVEAGRWKDGAGAFTRAIEAQPDNATFYFARGVARTLGEEFAGAIEDLQRALKLRQENYPEAKLWLATALRMSGDAAGGARHFAVRRGIPPDYSDFVYNKMAMAYFQSARRGGEPDRAGFARAAAMFARQAKGGKDTSELAPALLDRARAAMSRKDFSAAIVDLNESLRARPDDLDILRDHAICCVHMNDFATARRELTRVLTWRPNFVEGYAYRAVAAAMMGDARRARADLELCAKSGPPETTALLSRAEQRLRQLESVPTVDAARVALLQAARADQPWDRQVECARALVQATNARRLRLDETYQQRIREEASRIRARPDHPDAYVELARYLIEQVEPRFEKVEPHAQPTFYRHFDGRERELKRAEDALDAVLGGDPRHVRALIANAQSREMLGDAGQANALILRALEIAPDDPEALRMKAIFLTRQAAALAAQAAGLRETKVSSTTERRGDYIYEIFTYTYPTAGELARADALDAKARALFAAGAETIERAIRVSAGTTFGHWLEGQRHYWNGRNDQAAASYAAALKLDPAHMPSHDALTVLYRRTGQSERAIEQESLATNLLHTTAGPMLKLSWDRITKTAFTAAGQMLDRADALDAADPRVCAYRGVVAQAQERSDDALAYYRAALALEEAHAQTRGTSLDEKFTGPLDVRDTARSLSMGLKLADLLAKQGRHEEALRWYARGAAVEARIDRRVWAVQIPEAQLPDPKLETGVVPPLERPIALIAWSRLGAARCKLAMGQKQEAEKDFAAVAGYPDQILATEQGKDRLNEPRTRAVIALCRLLLERGEHEEARRMWMKFNRPWGLSEAAEREAKLLEQEIRNRRR
jgi:tetratricopeptide (TPR) repeat protein